VVLSARLTRLEACFNYNMKKKAGKKGGGTNNLPLQGLLPKRRGGSQTKCLPPGRPLPCCHSFRQGRIGLGGPRLPTNIKEKRSQKSRCISIIVIAVPNLRSRKRGLTKEFKRGGKNIQNKRRAHGEKRTLRILRSVPESRSGICNFKLTS